MCKRISWLDEKTTNDIENQINGLNPFEKESFKNRKKIIQAAFKKQMGPNVDKPKAGYATSSDDNTARHFFEKY